MSKILAREQRFDEQRRTRLEAPAAPLKEPQEPVSSATTSVLVVDPPAPEAIQPETALVKPPQPANNAHAPATKPPVETPALRWNTYLLITILFLPFFAYLLREPLILGFAIGPRPAARDSARNKPAAGPQIQPSAARVPAKQSLSARSVPPTLRFSAVGAIHEHQKALESERSLLPPTLRLLNVSSPIDLVSTQPFIRWEKTAAPVLQLPKQAVQSRLPIVAAINDPSQLAAVGSTLRALKLMDTAIANANRLAASENKKPGD